MLVVSKFIKVGGRVLVYCQVFFSLGQGMLRYLMAFWCKIFMRVLMLGFGIIWLISLLIECLCIAPRTPAVIVMRALIFQPFVL